MTDTTSTSTDTPVPGTAADAYIRTLTRVTGDEEAERADLLTRLAALTAFTYTGLAATVTDAKGRVPFVLRTWRGGDFRLHEGQVETFVAGACAGLLSTLPLTESLSHLLDPDSGVMHPEWTLPDVGRVHIEEADRTTFLVAYQLGLGMPRPSQLSKIRYLLFDVLA